VGKARLLVLSVVVVCAVDINFPLFEKGYYEQRLSRRALAVQVRRFGSQNALHRTGEAGNQNSNSYVDRPARPEHQVRQQLAYTQLY
jgi:hypothetical protein